MAIHSQEVLGAKVWRAKVRREIVRLAKDSGFTQDVHKDAVALLARVKHTHYDDARDFASDLIGMAIHCKEPTDAINALTTFIPVRR